MSSEQLMWLLVILVCIFFLIPTMFRRHGPMMQYLTEQYHNSLQAASDTLSFQCIGVIDAKLYQRPGLLHAALDDMFKMYARLPPGKDPGITAGGGEYYVMMFRGTLFIFTADSMRKLGPAAKIEKDPSDIYLFWAALHDKGLYHIPVSMEEAIRRHTHDIADYHAHLTTTA